MRSHIAQVFIAELFATFVLCLIAVLAVAFGNDSLLTVAAANGFTILALVAATSGISGAHINPAVTFGFVITGRMSVRTGGVYVAAQLIGATLAGLVLLMVFKGWIGAEAYPGGASGIIAAGTPQVHGLDLLPAILLEIIATFILVYIIFATAVDERAPRSLFPIAIGLTVLVNIVAFGPLTGAAMNPARHFGTAIVSGMWDNVIVYWIGPLVGSALAALMQHHLIIRSSPSPAVAEHGGPSPSEERG